MSDLKVLKKEFFFRCMLQLVVIGVQNYSTKGGEEGAERFQKILKNSFSWRSILGTGMSFIFSGE